MFHWTSAHGKPQRRPLAEGEAEWIADLNTINSSGRSHYALIDFVEKNDPASFSRDAAVLREWLARLSQQKDRA